MSDGDWLVSSGVGEKWEACKAGIVDGKVPAAAYAEAAIAIITVFDLISGMGTAAGIAKSDMNGNAIAIAKFAVENPGKSLQEVIDAELAAEDLKKVLKRDSAAVKLLWLQRALIFIKVLLATLESERGAKMSECVMKGYQASLAQYHGIIVRGTFNVAVKAAPSRDAFMKKLGSSEDDVFAKINSLMPIFNEVLVVNDTYLKAKGIEVSK